MAEEVVPAKSTPPSRSRWPLLSLLPLGLGSWAPIYAGLRAGVRRWVGLGVLWTGLTTAGWVSAAATNAHDQSIGGLLLVLGWTGAIATSFMIRHEYERQLRSPLLRAAEQAQGRLEERRRARRLAQQNPRLAAEMGIGHPDRPGALSAGLVDVNNATVTALLTLPGLDEEKVTQIVEGRARAAGFTSVEDLGVTLDFDAELVEALRDRVVFLPRGPA